MVKPHSSVLLLYFIEITFFIFTSRVNLLNLKKSSGRLVIIAKVLLKLQNFSMLIKQKSPSLSKKLGSCDFWRIANRVFNKSKFATTGLFNDPDMLSSATDKAKLFAKNFSKNSSINGSCISLPVFPSRANLILNNISVTPRMVKKVITNLDS